MIHYPESCITQAVRRCAYRHYSRTGKRYLLSSGSMSDEYLDVRSMILSDEGGNLLARYVDARIGKSDAVAGVETGGAILARLVGSLRRCPTILVRKEERTHGTTVDGLDGLDNLPVGAALWLIEDVITTGASTARALAKLLRNQRLQVAGVICVVDREQGGLDSLQQAGRELGLPALPVVALTTLSAVRAVEVPI